MPPPVSASPPEATDWPRVAVLIAAGIAAAVHIGKVPGALPVLTGELKLDLAAAALITAIYSLVAALAGLFFGVSASRFGAKSLVVGGLAIASAASLLGAAAASEAILLLSRVAEGMGFIMVSVSAPSLIIAATAPTDRRLALGLWGTYVPAGSSLMMVLGAATITPLGWRGVWVLAAILSGAMMLATLLLVTARTPQPTPPASPTVDVATAISDAFSPASRRLAACFTVYGAQYLAVVAFLPLILVETSGLSIAAASLCGAAVAAANILGNITAGWLGMRGWRVHHVLSIGALGMGLGALLIFVAAAPVALKVAGGIVFCAVGGLIPGTLLGAAPRAARTPAAAAGVVGLMVQGAAVGQLLGPPIFARIVKWSGTVPGDWSGGWIYTSLAALLILALAQRLNRP
jgi:MFS transporter, CP family, cyanate transporter